MIFAGLWFGTNKPQMLTFFSPFYEGLSKLETEGVYKRNHPWRNSVFL